ncbi:MAG: TolC family protein [Chryseolinea sp.]
MNIFKYSSSVFKVVIMMLAITSCKVTVESLKPEAAVPTTYGLHNDTANMAFKPWQIFYTDTTLTKLLGDALERSLEMKITTEEVNFYAAQFQQAGRILYPVASVGATSRVDRYGEYTMNGVGNDDTNRSESLPRDQLLPDPYPELFVGVNVSWEANLWKKLSSKRKAAQSRFMASVEMKHGLTTMLIGSVAQTYFELLGLDQEKLVLLENIKLQSLAVGLVRIQKSGGRVNQLAVDQFESQLLNTQNRLIMIEQEILSTESRINELIGRYPRLLARGSLNSFDTLERLLPGSPQQMVSQRPDIRRAEYLLEASGADVMVARAAFYPSLQVSGNAGVSAFSLSKLLLTPQSAVYSLAAGISAPLLMRRRIRTIYDQATAKQRMALHQYEKTVLNSYHEVYRSLNNGAALGKQISVKKREVLILDRAVVNSKDLFEVGFANYLEVINAQQRRLEVGLELATLRKLQLQNFALVYRTLGGGWTQSKVE